MLERPEIRRSERPARAQVQAAVLDGLEQGSILPRRSRQLSQPFSLPAFAWPPQLHSAACSPLRLLYPEPRVCLGSEQGCWYLLMVEAWIPADSLGALLLGVSRLVDWVSWAVAALASSLPHLK